LIKRTWQFLACLLSIAFSPRHRADQFGLGERIADALPDDAQRRNQVPEAK
jgi:hypothetical protein